MIIAVLLSFLTFIFTVRYFVMRGKHRNLPPGPISFPIVGNLIQIGKSMHISFDVMTKKYGNLFRVYMGNQMAVVVSDPNWIKEMLSNTAFTGRPQIESMQLQEDGEFGLVNSEGVHWEYMRRFTMRHLRDFGFGKTSMETMIMDEVKELEEWMKSQVGKPIAVKEKFSLAVVNSLWTIVSGKRFSHDDPKLGNLFVQINRAFLDVVQSGALMIFMPWIRHVIPEWSGYNKIRGIFDEFLAFFRETVTEHKQTFQEGNPRDFIDVALQEIATTKDPYGTLYGEVGEKRILGAIGDLFVAGSDTTSNTLTWAVLYLTTFQQVQKDFQKEIEEKVGNSRTVSLTDKPNMPYTEALIAEILRFSSIIPAGVMHRALVNQEFRGFHIPKGTWIMANLYHIHFSKDIWGDPTTFRPERFLSQDKTKFQRNENLLPFMTGKRQCLGENLARDTIFLFLTNIFQKFDSNFNAGEVKPSLIPDEGFGLQTKPFKVILTERWG